MGLLMVISPSIFFQITESWKSDNANEPSKLFKISTRVGGCFFIIIGIACLIFL
ncbi:DUF6199 family natural product biosynthesis protein [Pseudoflavonifractor phocaeensis]|uniref:DUF6199 family natural product biosynthesis protein n=1 Tax=Pseudoflavonifractor phocaeensis TaxID=1870988 RepID=UPI0030B89961